MTILITTSYSRRINETVLVEIGSETHEISILEQGFRDDTVDPLTRDSYAKAPTKPQSEDLSKSCSEQEQTCNLRNELSKGDVERESLNEMGVGKDNGECFEQPFGNLNSQQGEWEESGRESSGKLPKIIGENDNKSVEEKEKIQVSDLGLNTRSWVDVVSTGIQDQSTCVGGPSQKVGQEFSTEMVRVGENDLGLSAKEGVGVSKDKEVETIRVELDGAEVNHHEWAKEGDRDGVGEAARLAFRNSVGLDGSLLIEVFYAYLASLLI
ncbi:hypothetical protein V6N13_090193 [Hibiscus sabdariffa]